MLSIAMRLLEKLVRILPRPLEMLIKLFYRKYLHEKVIYSWSGWERRRHRKYLDELKECKKILDIGGGRGELAEIANELGQNVYAVDTIPRGKNVIKGDTAALPFRKEFFDGVIMAHTLEHFKDPFLALSEAYRVLKQDGMLLIVTPIYGKWFWHDPTHVRPYTREAIKMILEYASNFGYSFHFVILCTKTQVFQYSRPFWRELIVKARKL